MSSREDREAEAREWAQSARHCIGCALGLPHDSDQCEAARDEDTE